MNLLQPQLTKFERIVCAYAQPAAGLPGNNGPRWINTPLWLIVRGEDGVLREQAMQPDQQSKEIEALYEICASVHVALLSALAIHYSKEQLTP